MSESIRRVVLAFSGGLDTSVILKWLRQTYDCEVVTFTADLGQGEELEPARHKAELMGVKPEHIFIDDLREEFVADYVFPMMRANALYEGLYLLGTSIARPLIAKRQIEIAHQVDADAVSHGATGKGNDQVRFEVATRALAPDLEILAPVRNWGMTREMSIEYAEAHDIPVLATKEKLYSIDDNLFGRAIECGEMEDPWSRPPEGVWSMTTVKASEAREVVVGFEQGVPVSVDGTPMALHDLIVEMNEIVGAYGWGRLDMVENRRVGIKSRETYEAPGALALIEAHQDLESITLERDTMHEKQRLEGRFADLVYDGMWYSPLKEALDAFVDSTQRFVTGEVRLRLEPGRCYVVGRRSPHSLYDYGLATYDAADTFKHADSEGFVKLWGLGIETWAAKQSANPPGTPPVAGPGGS